MAESTIAKSKYDKYVVRRPGLPVSHSVIKFPDSDVFPNIDATDTGPRVILCNELIPNATTMIEYGFVMGDRIVGEGLSHKHNYEEIFLFLGTDPQDTTKLGAEVEFWLGEGEDRDKVVLTTSSAVCVPPNLAHFPQIWRNVTRPVTMVVIMPTAGERKVVPVPNPELSQK
jgi:hypothetical protein